MTPLAQFYRDLRIQQAATRAQEWNDVGQRNEDFGSMDFDTYKKKFAKKFADFIEEVGSREFIWDTSLPPDVLEPHDWLRLEPFFIRDWILNCKLDPHEACNGVFHEKRKWFTIWKRWDWVTMGACQIRAKEREIAAQNEEGA